jgi:hypothetical protein
VRPHGFSIYPFAKAAGSRHHSSVAVPAQASGRNRTVIWTRDHRVWWSLLLLGVIALVFLARPGYSGVHTGHVAGAIYFLGGPALANGESACHATNCPGRGRVTVRDARGKVVAQATLKQGHHFRFRLVSGRYVVSGGPGCTSKHVRIAPGRTTTATIGCDIV